MSGSGQTAGHVLGPREAVQAANRFANPADVFLGQASVAPEADFLDAFLAEFATLQKASALLDGAAADHVGQLERVHRLMARC